jgi:hypothetical protein
MKSFTALIAASGLLSVASATYYGNTTTVSQPDTIVTITTDILTTFCPSPTVITQGGKTYTVTASTTLTITGKFKSVVILQVLQSI